MLTKSDYEEPQIVDRSQQRIDMVFDNVAAQHPDFIAIRDCGRSVTYAELSSLADDVEEKLRAAGVNNGDFIAIELDRSSELVAAMIATLRLGGAYVPIDPSYPRKRREFIKTDSGSVVELSNDMGKLTVNRLLPPDERRDRSCVEDIAYVIYTSGSTGTPKGVLVSHANVLRLFTATANDFNFCGEDVWSGFHSPSFDFSVWEIWGALLHGGVHVIVPRQIARDPDQFSILLQEERVTVLNQTPSAFRNLIPSLIDRPRLRNLRCVVFGGEKLDFCILKPWVSKYGIKSPKLVNMYGITETTVHVSIKEISQPDIHPNPISPIGRPISDLSINIVSDSGKTAMIGEPGVIHVGGPGVSHGYLDRPELTRDRFYIAPDENGRNVRWYNSGDVGVQLTADEYGFIGREDRQIKLRGFRIELGEIEAAIRSCAGVSDGKVLLVETAGKEPSLIGVAIVDQKSLSDGKKANDRINKSLQNSLPRFMRPSKLILMSSFPTNENGKLDINACLEQEAATSAMDKNRDANSITVRGIWGHLLQRQIDSDSDDFFDLGGTSFTLIRMLRAVNAMFNTSVSPASLSEGATINALLDAIHSELEIEE